MIPPYEPRVDPRLVNVAFFAGVTLMLAVLLPGMQLYAVEALRSNMAKGFRALVCAPDGTLLKRCE